MITQEAIEKDLRSIERRCRGPHRRPVAVCVADLAAAMEASPDGPMAFEGEDEGAPTWWNEEVEATLLGLPTTQHVKAALLENGKRLAAGLIDSAARQPGCGQDVNDLILAAGHFDGESHKVTCPQCGTEISYTPAKYE